MRSAAKHVERKGKGWRPQGNRDEKEAQGLRSRKKVRSSERNDNRKRSWHFKRTGETDKKSAQRILVQETSAQSRLLNATPAILKAIRSQRSR